MNLAPNGKNEPITAIVTRIAKKGSVREFEEWMDGIIHEDMRFVGHMDVNIIRPADPSSLLGYVIRHNIPLQHLRKPAEMGKVAGEEKVA
jgi:antibiotic biosynthesis monooxygenase (ABM) superfamily enzyme